MYVDSRTNDTAWLSWAPGDAQPTTVLTEPVCAPARAPSAAYTADGRLWVSWTDDVGERVFAKLGDANGAGGSPLQLQLPAGFRSPQTSAALAAGNSLALVTNWLAPESGATAVWATVVDPPSG